MAFDDPAAFALMSALSEHWDTEDWGSTSLEQAQAVIADLKRQGWVLHEKDDLTEWARALEAGG